MTNFDFLKKEQDFTTFADAAIAAEKIINLDTAASVINCRRAMEIAVKWMYSVDADLSMPYQDLSLIHISEPTRQAEISYAVFCLKKKKINNKDHKSKDQHQY